MTKMFGVLFAVTLCLGLAGCTRTPAAPPRDPVIAAAGDIACGKESQSTTCRQMETSDQILAMNPDVVLALGDTQYEKGEYANFTQFYDPSWGRLKAKTRPAIGNHEYGTKGAKGYFDYFNGMGEQTGPAGDRDQGYYSFNVGAWHIIALNSNCTRKDAVGCAAGSAQEQWLRADLAANPTACSLMFMHHPLWSSDQREFELSELRPLYQAFYEAGGDLSLVGHSHFYERFGPQDPNGNLDVARGIREIIAGTGGRNQYGFGQIRPNSEARISATAGVLKLTLRPTSYDWEFQPLAKQAKQGAAQKGNPQKTTTDSGTSACH